MGDGFPYFKFYPSDFVGSPKVQMMDPAAVGIYVKLLCASWELGPLPTDARRLAKLSGADRGEFDRMWPQVVGCFEKTADGLVNPRLESEREDAHGRRQKARKAARASWRDRDSNARANANADANAQANADASDANAYARGGAIPQSIGPEGSSAARTRARLVGLDELKALLGERKAVADTASETIAGSRTWPKAIVGLYGPNGTRREVLAGLENGAVERTLAESLLCFVGESAKWHQPFFDSIVDRVAKHYRQGGAVLSEFSDADRRLILRRQEMESWDLAGSAP